MPEFRNKYLDRLTKNLKIYDFLCISQLEGYKSTLSYHLGLCLENTERLEELDSEYKRTRNFLRQESSIFISSFLEIIQIVEREGGHSGISQDENEYRAIHSLKAIENLILDDEPIFKEFSFMKHLNLDLDAIERAVAIVMARKRFLEYLRLEIEKLKATFSGQPAKEIEGTNEPETIYDSSLVKWRRQKGEFYYLLDAMIESGIIETSESNKKVATEQLARCLGLELAKTWQQSRSDEYKSERPLLDNGKTDIFKQMSAAFERLLEKRELITKANEQKDKILIQEIKDKQRQK